MAVCAAVWLLGCGGDDDGDVAEGIDAAALIDAPAGGGADAAPSGRVCASGLELGDPTAMAAPALECPSGVCLHVQGAQPDMCTAWCEEADDCVAPPESACEGAFVCTEPMAVGPFACRKACVCESAVPEGGFDVDC
jgi:hypothetical protein